MKQLLTPEAAALLITCNPADQACLVHPTVNDAVKVRMEGGVLDECEASADVLLSDTMDQYRTFQMCERLLHSPSKLGNQLLFQIPPHRQAILIERCSEDSLLLCPLSDVFPLSDLSVCHIVFSIYVFQCWSSLVCVSFFVCL